MLFTGVGFTLIRLCHHRLWRTSDADFQLQRWESAAVTVYKSGPRFPGKLGDAVTL